jgi:hypothetical protein
MQTTLTSLKNPRWANAEQTAVDCEITTSQFGNEILPFTANQYDTEPHGRAIFADIVRGAYGTVAEYVPPPPPPPLPTTTAAPATGQLPVEVL